MIGFSGSVEFLSGNRIAFTVWCSTVDAEHPEPYVELVRA